MFAETKATGLLISWATPAVSLPNVVNLSVCSRSLSLSLRSSWLTAGLEQVTHPRQAGKGLNNADFKVRGVSRPCPQHQVRRQQLDQAPDALGVSGTNNKDLVAPDMPVRPNAGPGPAGSPCAHRSGVPAPPASKPCATYRASRDSARSVTKINRAITYHQPNDPWGQSRTPTPAGPRSQVKKHPKPTVCWVRLEGQRLEIRCANSTSYWLIPPMSWVQIWTVTRLYRMCRSG